MDAEAANRSDEFPPRDQPPFNGPLHLLSFLGPCPDDLAKVIRDSVAHRVNIVRGLENPLRESGFMRYLDDEENSSDPERRRISSKRRAALKQHQQARMSQASSNRLAEARKTPPPMQAINEDDEEGLSRTFLVEVNEEDGVVRAFCRRTGKMILLFDRTLYWGMRRAGEKPPETFPYRSGCGGHTFEVGVGFDYDESAMDENDFGFVTIAVKCVASGEISLIIDEEAF